MKLEAPGPLLVGAEALAREPRPDAAARPELGDLLEKADGDVEEEREARQYLIGVPAARHTVACVLNRGGKRQSHRLGWGGPGLLHVLANDRDWVPLR